MNALLINVYHGGHIMNLTNGTNYDISASCTLPVSPEISLEELRRQIYVGLRLLPSQYTLKIRARINTAPPGSNTAFYSLFWVENEETWSMIKRAGCPVMGFHTLELVVESEIVSAPGGYDPNPNSIPGGSTAHWGAPVSEEEVQIEHEGGGEEEEVRREHVEYRYNDFVDENENWHLDETEGDETAVEDEGAEEEDEDEHVDLEKILNEWHMSIPFIDRGLTHPCPQISDRLPLPRADYPFYQRVPRIDTAFGEGHQFKSKLDLQNKIRAFHLEHNIKIATTHSSKTVLIMNCKKDPCKWRLYARKIDSGMWQISTNKDKHSCYGHATSLDHEQMTSRLIADTIRNALRDNLEMTVATARSLVKQAFPTVVPSYNKIWRGREMAIADLFGSWEKSYEMLPSLLAAIQATTPGTKFILEKKATEVPGVSIFHRVAWAYGPCIEAWQFLRPVISIDAGFLSGRYAGKFLMACAYDADQRLLPLAFGIVEEESTADWGWFMNWLRREVVGSGKITVISDQHSGIRGVFDQPHLGWCEAKGEAIHRFCTQHIAQNVFKSCHIKRVQTVFKLAAKHKKPWRCHELLNKIKNQKEEAYDYIMKAGIAQGKFHRGPSITRNTRGKAKKKANSQSSRTQPQEVHVSGPQVLYGDQVPVSTPAPKMQYTEEVLHKDRWAQHLDGGMNRWGIMTTNGSESLNNVFRIARQLPVCALVERTFYKVVHWFVERRGVAAQWEANGLQYTESVTELMKHRGDKGRTYEVYPLDQAFNYFDVINRGGRLSENEWGEAKYEVQLIGEDVAKCECLKPQLTGLPCDHVLAVCSFRHLNHEINMNRYYTLEYFKNTWSGHFRSYGNKRDWPMYTGPVIRPDPKKINKGRRKKIRIPMVMDVMQGRLSSLPDRSKSRTRRARN